MTALKHPGQKLMILRPFSAGFPTTDEFYFNPNIIQKKIKFLPANHVTPYTWMMHSLFAWICTPQSQIVLELNNSKNSNHNVWSP